METFVRRQLTSRGGRNHRIISDIDLSTSPSPEKAPGFWHRAFCAHCPNTRTASRVACGSGLLRTIGRDLARVTVSGVAKRKVVHRSPRHSMRGVTVVFVRWYKYLFGTVSVYLFGIPVWHSIPCLVQCTLFLCHVPVFLGYLKSGAWWVCRLETSHAPRPSDKRSVDPARARGCP